MAIPRNTSHTRRVNIPLFNRLLECLQSTLPTSRRITRNGHMSRSHMLNRTLRTIRLPIVNKSLSILYLSITLSTSNFSQSQFTSNIEPINDTTYKINVTHTNPQPDSQSRQKQSQRALLHYLILSFGILIAKRHRKSPFSALSSSST